MNVTLSIDTSARQELLEVRDFIDGLLGNIAEIPLTESGQQEALASRDAVVGVDMNALWPKLGANAQRLLWFAAQSFAPEEEFTFAELGLKMGLSVESVKAIHRNLSRALSARGLKVTDVLPARWDGERQHYHLSSPTHDVIRAFELVS